MGIYSVILFYYGLRTSMWQRLRRDRDYVCCSPHYVMGFHFLILCTVTFCAFVMKTSKKILWANLRFLLESKWQKSESMTVLSILGTENFGKLCKWLILGSLSLCQSFSLLSFPSFPKFWACNGFLIYHGGKDDVE